MPKKNRRDNRQISLCIAKYRVPIAIFKVLQILYLQIWKRPVEVNIGFPGTISIPEARRIIFFKHHPRERGRSSGQTTLGVFVIWEEDNSYWFHRIFPSRVHCKGSWLTLQIFSCWKSYRQLHICGSRRVFLSCNSCWCVPRYPKNYPYSLMSDGVCSMTWCFR